MARDSNNLPIPAEDMGISGRVDWVLTRVSKNLPFLGLNP
jgi:hypothetical protein